VRRNLIMSAVLAVAAAACGGGAAATSSTAATTTTAAPTTTTTTAAATTTAATTTTTETPTTTAATTTTTAATTTTATFYGIDTGSFFPAVFGDPGDPNGSGCIVGADVLPPGVWFGFADAVDGGTITFDLACFFTGAAATEAATADGAEAFDFYIRNQNPKTYSVPIASAASVFYVDPTTIEPTPIGAESWPTADSFLPCPGEYCAVWLYVNGGTATGIVEQYLP
jgi:hypothetical protein